MVLKVVPEHQVSQNLLEYQLKNVGSHSAHTPELQNQNTPGHKLCCTFNERAEEHSGYKQMSRAAQTRSEKHLGECAPRYMLLFN